MQEVLNLINEMSPYLLLGFLFAGILHSFVPGAIYSRYLSGHNFRSVFYAALFGVPLPLCSCGVIPTAMSLRKEGASKGATVSFLIATPETGVDSIAATYSLMGLPFAIVRPITAFFTSMLAGTVVNTFDKDETATPSEEEKKAIEEAEEEHRHECNCTGEEHHEHHHCGCSSEEHHHNHSCACTGEGHHHHGFFGKVKEALEYGFVDMLGDIGKWLLIGLIVAGLITVFVPDSFFHIFKGNTFLSMLLVLCIAIPMYICATGSIPIAVALIMKGLTPGAALVMLMAGPACNMASILVINKVLGKKTLALYLASIITGAIVAGTIIDQLPQSWFMPTLMTSACCAGEHVSWFNYACTIILALLYVNVLLKRFILPHINKATQEQPITNTNISNNNKNMKEYKIKGMNCSHCCANATKAIREIPGVNDVHIDLASGKAQVDGNVTFDQIKDAMESLGFSAEEI